MWNYSYLRGSEFLSLLLHKPLDRFLPLAKWVRFLQGTETLCRPSAILCGTEPVSALCTDTRAFILLRSLYFLFFVDFVCGNLSNINIQLPLFWSTWIQALGQDAATCADLGHGLDYSYCITSEQKWQERWYIRCGHCVSLNRRK